MVDISKKTFNIVGAISSSAGESQKHPAGFEFVFDRAEGFGRVILSGFFDIATADIYFAELDAFLKKVRSITRGKASILIDSTNSGVQGRQVMERLQEGNLAVLVDGDRTAMVVSSALLKMQIDRLPIKTEIRLFLTADEAITWLRNDHPDSA